jgi:hypothetical protein
MAVQGRTPTNISMKWTKTATRRTEWWVRGGDRKHQPTHGIRVEEDEFPRGKVAEGDLAGPDPPDEFRRGPSQKVAHQVQLALALEAAGVTKRRHGVIAWDGSQGSRKD